MGAAGPHWSILLSVDGFNDVMTESAVPQPVATDFLFSSDFCFPVIWWIFAKGPQAYF